MRREDLGTETQVSSPCAARGDPARFLYPGDNLLKSQRLKAFCAFGLKALNPSNQAVDSALHCS